MPDNFYSMEFLLYILSGASVGFIIGLTGVGGGALMTPLLLLFGFPTQVAIGTDLLYAAVTKSGGMVTHARLGHVNWRIVRLLATGSIPAALVTGWVLKNYFSDAEQYTSILTTSLGFMLILTASVLVLRPYIQKLHNKVPHEEGVLLNISLKKTLTAILFGVVLGVFVTLSSVGAGAIGTAVLMILFPALAATRVVGSDIAHAVPLTLVGGLVHLGLGHVDFQLLAALLLGSLPAIHYGSKLASRLPNRVMHPLLALMLFLLGVRYAMF